MPKLLPIQLGKVLFELTHECPKGELDTRITCFLEEVKKQQLMKKMTYILKAYRQFAQEASGTEDLHITSATELPKETITAIVKKFSENPKDVQVKTTVNPDVLSGVQVQKGNTIFDATAKAKLDKLKMQLQ